MKITVTVLSNQPLDVPFRPEYAVVDCVYSHGHVLATFSHKSHAKRFVKKAGYHPDRLTIHRIAPALSQGLETDA